MAREKREIGKKGAPPKVKPKEVCMHLGKGKLMLVGREMAFVCTGCGHRMA